MMTDEIVEMIAEAEIINHTIVMIDGTIGVEEMIAGMIEIGETLGTFIKNYHNLIMLYTVYNIPSKYRGNVSSNRIIGGSIFIN